MFSGGKNVIRTQKANQLKKFRDFEETPKNKQHKPKNRTQYRNRQGNQYE